MNDQCNGYTNYSTFLMALYSDQERDIAAAKRRLFIRLEYIDSKTVTPKEAAHFSDIHRLTRRCQFNEQQFDLSEVDWKDIARCWTTELEEHAANRDYTKTQPWLLSVVLPR